MPQAIICTTVPSGVHDGRLTVSLFLSPRLTPGGPGNTTLREFPDWLDWPAVLSQLQFQAAFRGNPRAITATRIDLLPEYVPSSSAWTSIFLPTSPVFGVAPIDLSGSHVVTSQSPRVHEAIQTVYSGKDMSAAATPGLPAASVDRRSIARAGIAAPVLRRSATLKAFSPTPVERSQARARIEARLRTNRHVPHAGSNPLDSFVQMLKFLEPFKKPPASPPPSSADYDFQKALSALLEYPGLMRRLGLIVDFRLNVAPSDLSPAELAGFIQIVPSRNPTWNRDVRPMWTAYAVEQVLGNPGYTFFLPRPRNVTDPYRHGFLRLNPAAGEKPWQAINMEVVSGALNLSTFAQQIGQGDEVQNLPALRTGPLALVETEIAARIVGSIDRGKVKEAALHPPAGAVPVPGAPDPTETYANDLIRGYCWDVKRQRKPWLSLCTRELKFTAPAQNPTLDWTPSDPDEAPSSVSAASALPATGDTAPPAELNVSHAVMRWGGWGLGTLRPGKGVTDDGQTVAPASLYCPQFPLLVKARPRPGKTPRLRIGDSYEIRGRLAYLTGPSFSPEEANRALDIIKDGQIPYPEFPYKRFDPVGHPAFVPAQPLQPGDGLYTLVIRQHGAGTESAEWHVVPPQMPEELAELHGIFDGLEADDVLAQIKRHEGHLPSGYDEEFLRRERQDNGFRIRIPYLPDPLCRGLMFYGLPSAAAPVPVTFGTEKYKRPVVYPNRYGETFRIELSPGNGAPRYQQSQALLTVELPPGESYDVPFSAYLWQQDLSLMGLLDWIKGAPGSDLATAVNLIETEQANKGDQNPRADYWFLTPQATMQLIHAVPKPVGPLTIRSLTATDRAAGMKIAALNGNIALHRPSTADLRIHAEWTDNLDTSGEATFGGLNQHADLAPLHVPVDLSSHDSFQAAFSQVFADTKYHHVTYTMTGISRYTSYYDAKFTADPRNVSITSNSLTAEILSSLPPASPTILYAIPTFGWEKPEKQKKKITRAMKGRGVRVYLERGWFSSGNGELLGVIFSRDRFDRLDLPVQRLVTQWGIDPIWPSSLPLDFPKLTSCINPAAVRQNFNLAVPKENSGPAPIHPLPDSIPVDVAGYSVGIDKENDRLWCDIIFDTGPVYRPFVRMALCRFQPNAIQGAWVSSVVQADFVQLASDRMLTITDGPGKHQKTVTVTGAHAQNADTLAEMVATLELRRHGLPETLKYGSTLICEKSLNAAKDPASGWIWSAVLDIPRECWFHKFQLTIREYEDYNADVDGDPGNVQTARRQVFFDSVEF